MTADQAPPGSPPSSSGNAGAAEQPGINLRVVAQYVKDLSYESPGAPGSLIAPGEPPQIEASVDVAARRLSSNNEFESELRITAKARRGETTVFVIELVYGGLFVIENAPQDVLQPLLLIECPRLLFPFARRIISDVTRDGGTIPLMLDPLDFAGLYRQQMARRAAEQGSTPPNIPQPVGRA